VQGQDTFKKHPKSGYSRQPGLSFRSLGLSRLPPEELVLFLATAVGATEAAKEQKTNASRDQDRQHGRRGEECV
jgi:hypothetical protein